MNFRWLTLSCALLTVVVADPALARAKHKVKAACADQPVPAINDLGRYLFLPTNRAPQPNGCAPPVYNYGKYVGQDPDPNIRFQLLRDPATGYSANQN